MAQVVAEISMSLMGRRLFDIVDGPHGWTDETGYGGGIASDPPCFVVTHTPPPSVRLGLSFTFVPEGLRAADVLRIHLSPIVLGAGTPLFGGGPRRELAQRAVRVSSTATHLTYDLP